VLLSAPISCCLCDWGTRVAATIGVVDERRTIGKLNKIEKVQNQYKLFCVFCNSKHFKERSQKI